jgi:hypothetical protein
MPFTEHAEPQDMPAGLEVTVPFPPFVTVREYVVPPPPPPPPPLPPTLWYSYAPMSQALPWGRETPRISWLKLEHEAHETAIPASTVELELAVGA